ncbi:MAG: DUF1778 domain-containing protein [Acidobacteriota bacterium]|nr:MAG: DUF1778 domain-containing protein [Acidobacteriota bacterium]
MSKKEAAIQKETRLSIRASEPEKAVLLQAARARHSNISQFVLQASLDAAHAILADQREFRLPPEPCSPNITIRPDSTAARPR